MEKSGKAGYREPLLPHVLGGAAQLTALRKRTFIAVVCLAAIAVASAALYEWTPIKAKALMPPGPNLAPDCSAGDESPCYV